MADTGGHLNELNGKMGISAPYRSVPVIDLIRNHSPKSRDELVDLIEYHYYNDCNCGIKSQGTVEDFGKNLHNAQKEYWGDFYFSLKECIEWEYDLFINQSLKGNYLEQRAKIVLNKKLPDFSIEEAEGFYDEELRIDLLIKENGSDIAGIQVKPLSFREMRDGVIDFNYVANGKWDKPVLYLYYKDNEDFDNVDEVLEMIKELKEK